MNICYCTGTYNDRVWQTKLCLERVSPFVDRSIIIVDQTVTKEQITEMEAIHKNVECHFHQWNDNFPEMRNHYLDKLEHNDWCIVSDPDELFNEEFVKKIDTIVERCEIESVGVVFIASYDIDVDEDGNESSPDYKEIPDDKRYYKQLMFKYFVGMKYEGVGETKNVHEMIPQPRGLAHKRLPTKYYYTHSKYFWEVWERATRNLFIGGGGNNAGELNIQWKPLRKIFSDLGVNEWTDARNYMRKGNVDQKLKQWMIDNRRDGWDYEHEMMEMFRWYFEYLHPEENIDNLQPLDKIDENSPQGIMRYVEQKYLEVLGRHAEQSGKESYTEAIVSGKMKKDDLEKILQESKEYKDKTGIIDTNVENIPIQFPVTVNVAIPPELIMTALKQSKTYKEMLDYVEWARQYIKFQQVHNQMVKYTSTTTIEIDKMINLFEEQFSDKENILDICSVGGYGTQQLSEKGYNVTGVHTQQKIVSLAKEQSDISLSLINLHNTKLPRNFFDAIFCSDVMPFIFSPWLFILELRKTLTNDGVIIMHLENYTKKPFLDDVLYCNPITPKMMKRLFVRAGFKEIKIKSEEKIFVFKKLSIKDFETSGYIKLLTW